ncbi:helicase-associated domain-containing protein [Leucobacter sp. cx-328]|uniref:helicase-associated domain-containing protein n=1 Tax=unclassified Leucobacter TaxID=2621730 RepID=UPI00165E0333|nr:MULTISPECIES: helicase-associated domain-containing protein [unclassified Leucobacter]MBC9943754.1 helicase-associated domain-containing protein [Leucobacter sp. cx-328]
MSGTLALATTIADLDRDGLTCLVRARRVGYPDQINDSIDLAQALLRPESVQTVLRTLNHAQLRALAHPAKARPAEIKALKRLGLLGRSPEQPTAQLPEVDAVLATLGAEHGWDASQQAPEPSPSAAPSELEHWYVPALTMMGQVAAVIRALSQAPLRLNRTGKPQTTAVRGLAEQHGTTEDEAFAVLALARAASLLVASDADSLVPAAAGLRWLADPQAERWLTLAAATLPAPEVLTYALADRTNVTAALTDLPRLFPFVSQATRDEAACTAATWDALGVTVDGQLSAAGEAMLAGDLAAAREAAEELPAPVPGVYVQPDLSVIVPGPLAAADEAALAECTIPEHIGVASTLRVTEAAMMSAFDRGVSEATIRATFERLSLTGVPQPLDYLISAAASRTGSLIVHEHDGFNGRARLEVRDPALTATLLVDRTLAHLQLHYAEPVPGEATEPDNRTLYSQLRADHVLSALIEARYPAMAPSFMTDPALAQQAASATEAATAETAASATATPVTSDMEPAPTDSITALVDRVSSVNSQSDGLGDIPGRLALAHKDKLTMRVTVEIRGDRRDFVVTPISIGAGRVRALDVQAGVERTFPVAAITVAEPAELPGK